MTSNFLSKDPSVSRIHNGGGAARWRVLIGAVAVQLILGTVYGYSIFWTPLQEKVFVVSVVTIDEFEDSPQRVTKIPPIVVKDEAAARKEHDRREGLLKYIFSTCYVAFAGVMLFAGRIQDLKGPRFTATIGGVLIGAGFLTAGLLLDWMPGPWLKLILLWGTAGLMAGAGIGFAYVCPIAALIKWFPDKKGLVCGVAVAGFGFGAFLFKGGSLFGALGFIERFGIERFFIVHGLVCLLVVAAGAMMLRNPPCAAPVIGRDSTWQQTLRRPAFYVLWLMFFSGVAGLLGMVAGNQSKQWTGSYEPAFIAFACLCVVSAVLAVGLWMQRRRTLSGSPAV